MKNLARSPLARLRRSRSVTFRQSHFGFLGLLLTFPPIQENSCAI
ncbi:hypothetical protein [Moorena producens]